MRHYPALTLALVISLLAGCGGSSGAAASDPDSPAPSASTHLSALAVSVGALQPAFDPATSVYTVEVGRYTPTLAISAAPSDTAATVRIDGIPMAAGSSEHVAPLQAGPNPIEIAVTSADGMVETRYTIIATRAATPTFEAYAKASNTGAGDAFGTTIALSGDTLVVGAPYEDSNATGIDGNSNNDTANASGAAYVFVRTGATWSQQAYVKASNAEAGDLFGWCVAIHGDTIAVGALNEGSAANGVGGDQTDNSLLDPGAVYVFVRTGTSWQQQAYVKASNTDVRDRFGTCVALHGNTLLVGAPGESSGAAGVGGNEGDNAVGYSGAAYVFTRTGSNWSQQAYLKASNPGLDDRFGSSVAIHGDTAVVGAPREESSASGVDGDGSDNGTLYAGAAYVFERTGTTWQGPTYLKASDPGEFDSFGTAVAVTADTIVVGAPGEDSRATGTNGVEIDAGASGSGAVYVFVRGAGTWLQQAYLKASNTGAGDSFGTAVSIAGDMLVVGAHLESSTAVGEGGDQGDDSQMWAGAAYVYTRSDDLWLPPIYLKASSTSTRAEFGVSVAASGETIAVGAGGESSSAIGIDGDQADDSAAGAGAAYVIR